MILVTGASGNVGGTVLDAARKAGLPLKAMYRSEADAKKAGAHEDAVIADFADPASLRRALAGVDTVFLVCSPIPQLIELENNVIQACKEMAVRHIVLNSALGAADYPKSFPSWHRQVEERLKSSAGGYTILRPNSFMQNIVAFNAPSIRSSGAFYSAMGKARVSLIDVRDVGAAAAKIMASPAAHAGKIYELNGPEAVSYDELARRIARASGSVVKFVDIPEAAQRKAMLDSGMPEWQAQALLDLQRYYTQGQGGEVTDVLAGLLGRQPTMLDSFLAEFADQFRAAASA